MDIAHYLQTIAAGDLSGVVKSLDESPFLAHVPNPDPEAWDEHSPLHCAARHGHLDLVKLLVERGAEVYSHPTATYPAVIVAAWNKHQPVVDYFLQEIPDRAAGTRGLGVTINLAARQGWVDLVRRHIELDPLAVHQRGWIGDSPLHWPAHNNHCEIVGILLDAGAVIEADEIQTYGGKALHWASEHAPAAVELLLSRGADVNARNVLESGDKTGYTPLIMNATQNDDCAEVTELLIAAGADLAATDAEGKTALRHALDRGLERITEMLRRHGAP